MSKVDLTNQTVVGNKVIYETTDYDIFHFIEGNRDVDWKHVNRLKKEISEEGQKEPILVDPDFGINDGQHRFECCRELGIPVKWTFDKKKSLFDIANDNSTRKNWEEKDYLKSYLKMGSIPIKRVTELMNIYHVTRRLVTVAAGKDNNLFSKGHFENKLGNKTPKDPMDDASFSKTDFVMAEDHLKYAVSMVDDILSMFDEVRQRTKVIEVILLFDRSDGFDRGRLRDVLKKNGYQVPTACSAKAPIALAIRKLYNLRKRSCFMDFTVTANGNIKDLTCNATKNPDH